MAIVGYPPHTIRLSGHGPIVNDIPAGVAGCRPGMLVELYDNGGKNAWRPHTSATNVAEVAVVLEESYLNPSPYDILNIIYAAGDLLQVWKPTNGGMFWGLIPSGANIANAAALQSNGDGFLKAATAITATANVAKFRSHDLTPGAVTVPTHIRVEVVG